MKILIVDDDSAARKVAETILHENGYETVSAVSVKTAINQIESGSKISLILLDINLPEEDGYALLRYLKTIRQDRKIPVIMCSSAEDENSVMQSINLGAVGYILKPVAAETLLPKISDVIGKYLNTILIVDDEKVIRDLLKATLEREGYNTVAVESGARALKAIEAQRINAVISDIQMEQMNGLELLEKIKATHVDLPVLMITGHSGKYNKSMITDSGADGFVSKPFKNLEILKALNEVLGNHAVR